MDCFVSPLALLDTSFLFIDLNDITSCGSCGLRCSNLIYMQGEPPFNLSALHPCPMDSIHTMRSSASITLESCDDFLCQNVFKYDTQVISDCLRNGYMRFLCEPRFYGERGSVSHLV